MIENPLIQKLRDDLSFSEGYKSEKHPGAEAVVITSQAAVKAAMDELTQLRADFSTAMHNLNILRTQLAHYEAQNERLRGLLKESVDKMEHYTNKQGRVRMGEVVKDGDGNKHQTFINPNPQEGQHYPAVQSLIDRVKHALAQPAPTGDQIKEGEP